MIKAPPKTLNSRFDLGGVNYMQKKEPTGTRPWPEDVVTELETLAKEFDGKNSNDAMYNKLMEEFAKRLHTIWTSQRLPTSKEPKVIRRESRGYIEFHFLAYGYDNWMFEFNKRG